MVNNRVLTLPLPLAETLEGTNGTKFLAALKQDSALLSTVSDTPKVTVFAPADSVLATNASMDPSVLRRHFWTGDLVGYTPELINGKTYPTMDASASVTITYRDDEYYANDAKILTRNVITKNGVIHYIDRVGDTSLHSYPVRHHGPDIIVAANIQPGH